MRHCRTLLSAVLVLFSLAALPVGSAAQPNPSTAQLARDKSWPTHALGIRLTGGMGFKGDIGFNEYPSFGAELSYQRFFSPKTRLEADFGMRFYDYNPELKRLYPAWLIATSYQWRWPVGRTAGFYAGPALQFGRPYFWFGLGAQAGFDWQLDGPFQLSVDIRPTYSLWSGLDACLSLGLRYLL